MTEQKQELCAKLDKMSYSEILCIVRYAPSESPYVQGEVGTHLMKRFRELKASIDAGEAVAVSKSLGWS